MKTDILTASAADYTRTDIDPMARTRDRCQLGQDPKTIHLAVYPGLRHQTPKGHLRTFCELGADTFACLPEPMRKRALASFNSPGRAALNFC